MVCAVLEIEKSTSCGGEGEKCYQDARKSNFTAKCLKTFEPVLSLIVGFHM